MATLKAKKTYDNLLKKGFCESTTKSKDHKWIEFWYNGKLTRAKTRISHNENDLNDFLISQMSKQVYLNKNEFIKMVSCEIEKEGYTEILRKKGFI